MCNFDIKDAEANSYKCLQYDNIYGQKIGLNYRYIGVSSEHFFQEFVIDNPPKSIVQWLTFIVTFVAISYSLLQNQVLFLLLNSVFLVLIYVKITSTVEKESMLIIRKTGIQIQTTFALGRRKTQFIAWERIHDVVINEAITLQRVIFYLAILLCGGQLQDSPEGIMPVFQHTLPRLECITKIYRSIYPILD